MKTAFGVFGLLIVAGATMGMFACYPEHVRDLNHQNREAGAFVAKEAEKPAVKQAGKDVAENSNEVLKTTGEPENPVPYTPEASAEARKRAEEERTEEPAFLGLVKGVSNAAGIGWLGTAAGLAWGVIGTLGRRKAVQKLTAVYAGVEEAAAKVGEGKFAGAIKDTMKAVAGARNVYSDIKKDLKKLKAKGELSEKVVRDPVHIPAPPPAA